MPDLSKRAVRYVDEFRSNFVSFVNFKVSMDPESDTGHDERNESTSAVPSPSPRAGPSRPEKLARTARLHLAAAIAHDEARRYASARLSYARAIELLRTFLTWYSSHELAPTVRRHLTGATARLRSLCLPKSSTTLPATSPTPPVKSPIPANNVPRSLPAPAQNANSSTQTTESGVAAVRWSDVSGLDGVKSTLHEIVVLPALRPDLFRGLRAPARGVLLFGPPGTGKTLIARAVAGEASASFFAVSASNLTGKMYGESERLVRGLFESARKQQPSFIFIDEVDALLSKRSDNEHEASRRLKNEFMLQFDGVQGTDARIVVMGASNRPMDIDPAVLRRLDRRIYVPLPDLKGRTALIQHLVNGDSGVKWSVTATQIRSVAKRMVGFSGADVKAVCREASLYPLRELGPRVKDIDANDVRGISADDLESARRNVRPSATKEMIAELDAWNTNYGSSNAS